MSCQNSRNLSAFFGFELINVSTAAQSIQVQADQKEEPNLILNFEVIWNALK